MCCTMCLSKVNMRGWMDKEVVCRLECPWFGGCPAITVLTVISVCSYSKWYVHEEKINTCVSEYTISNLACASWRWTSCPEPPDNFAMYSDDKDSVSSNSEEQQPSASRDADYLPSTDTSYRKITEGKLMTSWGISNFQKIRQNFWHQGYNSGIYYTTLWKWQHFAPETKNSSNGSKP